MKLKLRKIVSVIMSMSLMISGTTICNYERAGAETLENVANGRNAYTFLTSNANTPVEGFLYVGNGFSAINVCNENLGNGNNLLGRSASTDEVAIYVDLGEVYNISSAKLYQGSTNVNFYDSYCKNYSIYYSTEAVSAANQGNIEWNLAGICMNGTIYDGGSIKIQSAEAKSTDGDTIVFLNICKARSVKVVFDKEACMGTGTSSGTGTVGTVSVVSFQVYGEKEQEQTTSENIFQPTTDAKEQETGSGMEGRTDILFIGNSMTYYNTLCNVVQGIATRKGHNVKCTAATNGGKNLVYQSTAENILNAIKTGGYEIVVLQDIVGSFDGDKLMQGAQSLVSTIKQYNTDADIVFYEPWPVKGSLTGNSGLLPYFTYNYIKAARNFGAYLAPAGEAFYDIYVNNGWDYYCSDEKHPQPLGTFVSASTIYHTIFPEEQYNAFETEDQTYLDDLINNNVAYTSEGKESTYSLDTLNTIFEKGYQYAHEVREAVSDTTGKTTYTSIAGEYFDADDAVDKTGLTVTTGTTVDSSRFTKANGNIAIGCEAVASTGDAFNAVDGNTGTRWESVHNVDPQWIYVDLKTEKNIKKVGFIWEGAYASKYYVQISDDGGNWTTVSMVQASSAKTVQIELDKVYKTRYIRMYGTRRGTVYGYSVYEIGVWEGEEPQEETTQEQIISEKETSEPETTQPESSDMETSQIETSKKQTLEQTTDVLETRTSTKDTETQKITNVFETESSTKEVTTVQLTAQEFVAEEKTSTQLVKDTDIKQNIKKTKIKKITKNKVLKKVKVSLKKVKGVSGYQIKISTSKKFKKNKSKGKYFKKNKFVIRKLKENKIYYIKARTYVIINGSRKYSKWTKVKKLR